MSQRVGFIGLGNIGKPMALRLAGWEGGLTVFDLAPEPLADAEKAGARIAASVAGLAAECGVISVMVNTDDQVREVMGEILGAARPGTVVAVHSTISPDLPPRLEDLAGRHDLLFVDAPVSGGAMGADAGTLAIMVGGSDEAFAAVSGPFALMGSEVVHCGPAGNGTAAKLARNLLHFVAFTATGEALRLAEASGIDLQALGRVVRHTDSITGGPGAIMHRSTAQEMEPGDGWVSIFEHVHALGAKDLGHAIELADRLGVEVPMARFAQDNLRGALGLPAPTEDEEN
ncbi:NAD(P)-dependent oxidoreductase [Nocardioides marmoriginsengisoli]|uniref:NAD(P)-dependent oxidoreductase n=1 Tax=Nocardioides marmoriginsengisoli TaxID=661483 RepID=A0A3N0CBN6_9ACTN|nr:NAD(P)-dependent oxidoreductase [Nocardioides marmoriginsengisoli]RNL60393.1 NAD(P)-dependent oxidoreductase [Nocardioides marmoriginsengisoli]